jgi:hypothetical protein
MEDLLISMALSIIFSAIKNPTRKIALKKAMLKLRNQINALYIDDPDF